MNSEYEFNYTYQEYNDGVFGKCVEMPAISAQGKTRDEVCGLLHDMTDEYLELVKEHKKNN